MPAEHCAQPCPPRAARPQPGTEPGPIPCEWRQDCRGWAHANQVPSSAPSPVSSARLAGEPHQPSAEPGHLLQAALPGPASLAGYGGVQCSACIAPSPVSSAGVAKAVMLTGDGAMPAEQSPVLSPSLANSVGLCWHSQIPYERHCLDCTSLACRGWGHTSWALNLVPLAGVEIWCVRQG